MVENNQTFTARTAIVALLQGAPPDGIKPDECGRFAGPVTALYGAYDKGGTNAVRKVWPALCNANPGLAELVSGEPLDEQPRYVIHTAAEALEPQPPLEWIVEGVFAAGSVSIVAGEPGCGKTYALVDCGVAVANGEGWVNLAVKACAVLLVDEESGPRRLMQRLGDTLRGHNAGPDTRLYWISLARFDLWDSGDATALESAIAETGAGFVVIDALADVMPGRDENSVRDVQPVFMALRSIAERTQAALVIIHHNNKAGGYRGSSAIKGAVDGLISIDKIGDTLTFKDEKSRDVESVEFAARMNWDAGVFNLSPVIVASSGPSLSKGQRYVLRYLKEHGASFLQQITSHADVCSPGTAKNAVYALTDMGLCERVDEGRRGSQATYSLTEKGLALC